MLFDIVADGTSDNSTKWVVPLYLIILSRFPVKTVPISWAKPPRDFETVYSEFNYPVPSKYATKLLLPFLTLEKSILFATDNVPKFNFIIPV